MRGHNRLGRLYGQTVCAHFHSFLFHELHGKLYGDLGSLELTVLHSDSPHMGSVARHSFQFSRSSSVC